MAHPKSAKRLIQIAVAVVVLVCGALPSSARTSQGDGPNPADKCYRAAYAAAAAWTIPTDVLLAVTLTETGRRRAGAVHPWPWTVNVAGRGKWFDTREAAQAFVDETIRTGERSFDIGCFQINARWHGHAFRSEQDMFDPHRNADYAARFLRSLFEEFGSWRQAAGAYHSRTSALADRYLERFDTFRLGIRPQETAVAQARDDTTPKGAHTRVNTFPLLQPRPGRARLGSAFQPGADQVRPLLALR